MRGKSKKTGRETARRRLIMLLILTGLLVVLSILAPVLTPNDPTATNPLHMNEGPSSQFPLGTDRYGRCVLSRVMMGARTSIFSALTLVAVTFAVGTMLGMLAGYCGGIVDTIVMRMADILLSFPQMVLAIAVAGILGGGMLNAMLAMGISGWTLYARLARAQALSIKQEPYVCAARLCGCGNLTILFKYLLPNMIGTMVVNASTQIGTMMIGIAGLSFLGFGVMEPRAEWGSMINQGRAYLQLSPWPVLAPAAATVITVMLFNYLGDSVRDCFDMEAIR